ncbi:hypothetical protein JCM6882_007637 [Rhodosporidiobolus microsporus]
MHPSSASFEAEHVHAVYNEIAHDFSRTRHSRWPFVERFLDRLPPGSLVLDVGTGNGKYLGCRSVLNWDGKGEEGLPRGKGKGKGKGRALEHEEENAAVKKGDLLPVGFDMSSGLLGIASGKGHEVVRGDCVDLRCWRRGAFNHAISIATIHHFATPARRVESIKQMILAVLPLSPPSTSTSSSSSSSSPAPPEAQLLIVVWSLEQDPSLLGARSARRTTGGKKGAVPVSSLIAAEDAAGRPPATGEGTGAGEEQDQDVFVPWERQEPQVKKVKPPKQPRGRRAPVDDAAPPTSEEPLSPPVSSSSEPIVPQPTPQPAPSPIDASPSVPSDPLPAAKPTFNRYYHLFRQYELSSLCRTAAAELRISFTCPAGYALEPEKEETGSAAAAAVRAVEGWEAYLTVHEERWERENWVVELGVGWRRVE